MLLAIDQDTRAKLTAATDAALERALERAGNRLRAKARQHRDTLRQVQPRLCAATLGPSMVAAAGVDDADLLDGAWDALEQQFRTVGGSAQKRALDFAGRIVGGFEPSVRRDYGLRQAADLDEAWDWMKGSLTTLAKGRLYHPDLADPELGEFDPTSRTPTGLIRQAMRRAGGVRGSANLAEVSTSGQGSAWVSVPDGSAPGGIATGQLIEDIIRDEGGSVQGYRWVYGPADRRSPFRPHMRLDGLVFASFTDPRLVIGGSFPSTGHYIPGDHVGCICDVEPIVLTPEQVAQLQAQGYLPDVPNLPAHPAPVAAPPTKRRTATDTFEAEFRRRMGEPPVVRHYRAQLDTVKLTLAEHRARVAERTKAIARLRKDIEKEMKGASASQRAIKQGRLDALDEELAYMARTDDALVATVDRKAAELATVEQAWAERQVEALRLYRLQREDMPAGLSAKGSDAWLAERWGSNYTGTHQRTIATAGLGPNNGPKVARAWHTLAQRYSNTADTVLRFGNSATVTREAQAAVELAGNASRLKRGKVPAMGSAWADAWQYQDAQWIRMGPTMGDAKAAEWAKLGPANVANGWHPPGGDTVEAVFTHEFGHHVHYTAVRNAKNAGVESAWDKAVANLKRTHMRAGGYTSGAALTKAQLSQYAMKNEFELFAEAFSYVETEGDEATDYAKALHRLVIEWAEGDAAEQAARAG